MESFRIYAKESKQRLLLMHICLICEMLLSNFDDGLAVAIGINILFSLYFVFSFFYGRCFVSVVDFSRYHTYLNIYGIGVYACTQNKFAFCTFQKKRRKFEKKDAVLFELIMYIYTKAAKCLVNT